VARPDLTPPAEARATPRPRPRRDLHQPPTV
jgi:hypothetical protein